MVSNLKKKVVAGFGLAVVGVASFASAVGGAVVSHSGLALGATAVAVTAYESKDDQAKALTMSGSRVIVETADVDLAMSAAGDYSATTFESLKFLGVIALIAGATYILDKIFSILPRGRSAG